MTKPRRPEFMDVASTRGGEPHIHVPLRIFQFLAHHALTHLWYLAQDEEAGNGCCRLHCGVCCALYDLHEDLDGDKLSEALREYCSPGDGWWIDDHVDWDAMQAAWERGKVMCTACSV